MNTEHRERATRFPHVPLESIPALRSSKETAVLNICADPPLLETRTAILQVAGFHTVAAGSAAAALRELSAQPFQVVVLCHPIPARQRKDIGERARQRIPGVRTIMLYKVSSTEAADADVAMDSHEYPDVMINAIRKLT